MKKNHGILEQELPALKGARKEPSVALVTKLRHSTGLLKANAEGGVSSMTIDQDQGKRDENKS